MSQFLVVDDNSENRYMLRSLLEGTGHKVIEAVNGLEAIEKAKTQPCDMIISDVMMPKMDGFRLCEAIKTDPDLQQLPFIFYTATFTGEKDMELGLSLGASRYIVKPMETDEFLDTITEVLSEYAAHRLPVPKGPAKEQQELLQMYQDAISSKLENKIQELEEANKQLKQEIIKKEEAEKDREHLLKMLALKNEELESIIYVSSHDLRTPIINVMGYSGELRKSCIRLKTALNESQIPAEKEQQLLSIVEEEVPMALDFIHTGAAQIDKLQQGLLKLCHLGTEVMNIETVDMNGLINDVIKSMQAQIDEANATVTVSELPSCLGDKEQLLQAFTNLLDNAIKYRDPNRPGIIHISRKNDKNMSVYCIEDNGVGINPICRERVFEIFHRLNPNGPVQGDGLGLTIARRLVQRQNGNVWMESEPGKGSCFFVALPSSEAK